MKKIISLALVLVMVLGLSTAAFAADSYTVTINNATGHTYKIYQIFTGDISGNPGSEVLANLEYGADYHPDGATGLVPKSVLDTLETNATSIQPTGAGTLMTNEGDIATYTAPAAGYYMIVDVTESLPAGDTRSAVMFQVVGDTEITSKHTGTTIEKKVQDINDSTGEYTVDSTRPEGEETWIDSADYDIGDTVPFKSTANFEGLDNYTSYKVVFTDTMSKGLTYNGGMKVYVNGEDKTSSFDITATPCTDTEGAYVGGTVITVSCDNIKPLTADEKGNTANSAEIVLVYTATLNENANIGAAGNPNKIKVTTKPDGSGETPEDVNIVFTYKVVANKYANKVAEGNKLNGAGFTLFKWDNTVEGEDKWVAIGEEIYGEAFSTFEWKGIDDGKYKLVETTTPAGYNTIDPIEFEVVAGHTIVADAPVLETLNGGDIFSGNVETGVLAGDVINNSGVELPETGGIGTTIFYIVGGILVLGAVVLLVTKKRMNAEA